MKAPIAIFAYKRYLHLKRTIESLLENPSAAEHELFIFCDGARSETERDAVNKTREFARAVKGFKKNTVIESEKNLGLANSVTSGVTKILKNYDSVIVLEDDMLVAPGFLDYMDTALELYRGDDRVISIHAYIYPIKEKLPDTFFLMGADCWGWGTWRRGWNLFNPDGAYLLEKLKEKKLVRRFDFDGAKSYSGMLEGQIRGEIDSWAVRWYASALLAGKLTLYPGKSLLQNIGNDSSGANSVDSIIYDVEPYSGTVKVGDAPLSEDKKAYEQFRKYFLSVKSGFIKRCCEFIIRKIKR